MLVLRKTLVEPAVVNFVQEDGLGEKLELTVSEKYSWIAEGPFTQCQVTGCFHLEHPSSVLIGL